MTEIDQIKFSKAELQSAPQDERLFHLMGGQLANDINYLTKTISFAFNPISGPPVRQRANISLATFLIKVLAGRLTEGHQFLNHRLFCQIYTKYTFSENAMENLSNINSYFANHSNALSTIRNKFAFHNDASAMRAGYTALPDDYLLSDYDGEFPGNRLYYSSELVTAIAIASALHKNNWLTAINEFAGEAAKVASWFGEFIHEFMKLFREKHISPLYQGAEYERITMLDAPTFGSIPFPFFWEPAGVK